MRRPTYSVKFKKRPAVSNDQRDPLWPHFAPLWAELRTIAPGLVLTGGYGLFLKQKWLLTEAGRAVPTVVHVYQWGDQTPRVTKDLDFIAEVNLIASAEMQRQLDGVLAKQGFTVVPKNARWQFEKRIDAQRSIVLDFHAPTPHEERDDVRVQARRVKPSPSQGQIGIHGRENPEAFGCGLHPFNFTIDDVAVVLPNPITMTIMKLVAMRDRRVASQNANVGQAERALEEGQARKHAQDIFRIAAMTTRQESDLAPNVLQLLRPTAVYAAASETFLQLFGSDSWGTDVVSSAWRPDDVRLILGSLTAWFS